VTVQPTDLPGLLRAGQAHHIAGRLEEARAAYRAILAQHPDHASALGMLTLALASDLDDPETEAMAQRHLAQRPFDGASLHILGQIRLRQGDEAEAAVLLERATGWLPRLAPIHNDLGVALQRLGRTDAALAALDKALALDADYAAAHGNRGETLHAAGRYGEALEELLTALRLSAQATPIERAGILHEASKAAGKAGRLAELEAMCRAELADSDDPDLAEALAQILEDLGQPDEVLAIRNQQARIRGLSRGGVEQGAARVLLLGGVGAGHVPVRYLLDTAVFETLSLGMLSPDQADAPLGGIAIEALAAADVVFSTLGDIDRDGGQLAAARDLCARLGKPVINPPDAIAKTGRDMAPALFAGIDGLIVPEVERLTPQALAGTAITAPMLVRPPGDHGGDNLTLLRTDADRDAWLASNTAGEVIVTRFEDFCSADGHWRKYRFAFVDRRPYPYHLAIGDDWLVHYWRAEMGRSEAKKAEEARFLSGWRGLFGPRGAAAVEAVAHRLDLDYGGLDCALMADGRVLLFEANACILVHLDEPARAFPYKHTHVPAIRDAFTRLVLARAGKPAATPG
jgi:Flp pilus assembly protein TadD